MNKLTAAQLHGLLSREEFRGLVFIRDKHRCVFCLKPAVDAHHIFDRKLFPDNGYYLNNGASVCEACHWMCETTEFSVEQVTERAGIKNLVYPPELTVGLSYDKWGNLVNSDGTRVPGPMFHEENVQKILKKAGLLYLFVYT